MPFLSPDVVVTLVANTVAPKSAIQTLSTALPPFVWTNGKYVLTTNNPLALNNALGYSVSVNDPRGLIQSTTISVPSISNNV